jgi:hypothetical protein
VAFVIRYVSQTHYTSKLPVTIYYTPPKDIGLPLVSQIFRSSKEKILTAMMYFRATKGQITIEEKIQKSWLTSTQDFLIKRNLNSTDELLKSLYERVPENTE